MLFDIQRCCVHDGPGIRTTVFLKGCPLRCGWCHNPESQSGAHQTNVFRQTPAQTLACLLRDQPFYSASGGGVTLSGGEPMAQPDYCRELLHLCRSNHLHTCIETSGWCAPEVLTDIAPLTDLFLYDFKLADDAAHQHHTGKPLTPILRNLELLCEKNAKIILRCPVIEGINDTDQHFAAIVALLARLPIASVELMPYHNAGHQKAAAAGLEQPFLQRTTPPALAAEWNARLEKLIAALPLNH